MTTKIKSEDDLKYQMAIHKFATDALASQFILVFIWIVSALFWASRHDGWSDAVWFFIAIICLAVEASKMRRSWIIWRSTLP